MLVAILTLLNNLSLLSVWYMILIEVCSMEVKDVRVDLLIVLEVVECECGCAG